MLNRILAYFKSTPRSAPRPTAKLGRRGAGGCDSNGSTLYTVDLAQRRMIQHKCEKCGRKSQIDPLPGIQPAITGELDLPGGSYEAVAMSGANRRLLSINLIPR